MSRLFVSHSRKSSHNEEEVHDQGTKGSVAAGTFFTDQQLLELERGLCIELCWQMQPAGLKIICSNGCKTTPVIHFTHHGVPHE